MLHVRVHLEFGSIQLLLCLAWRPYVRLQARVHVEFKVVSPACACGGWDDWNYTEAAAVVVVVHRHGDLKAGNVLLQGSTSACRAGSMQQQETLLQVRPACHIVWVQALAYV
jgi:hypothetical protein